MTYKITPFTRDGSPGWAPVEYAVDYANTRAAAEQIANELRVDFGLVEIDVVVRSDED